MKNVLITGISGMIGTRLCEKLLSLDFKVIGVDKRENKWRKELNSITLIGDLGDTGFVRSLPGDIDIIIHLAANARVYDLVLVPDLAFENIQITYNVMEYGRVNNIKKIIFASSREVYGNVGQEFKKENEIDISYCESSYTASKISGEALIHAYRRCYDMDSIILRFSNVYGMYDDSDRVVPLFISRIKEGKDLIVYGKDKMLDFTYIDDTVDGITRSIQRFEKAKNNVINIASGKCFGIVDLAKLMIDKTSCNSKLCLKPNRTGEVIKFRADISKAMHLLGYSPKTTIYEGITKALAWYDRQSLSIPDIKIIKQKFMHNAVPKVTGPINV